VPELEHLRGLCAINRVIANTSDCDNLLRLIVERTTDYVHAVACLLLITDANSEATIAAAVGVDTDKIARFRAPLDERIGEAVSELLGFQAEDIFLGVPVLDQGSVRGILVVYKRDAVTGEPDEEFLLSALADQAAIVLGSARYKSYRPKSRIVSAHDDHLELKMQSRPAQLASILSLSRQVIAGLDVPALMRESLTVIVSNLGLDYGLLLEALPDAQGLLVRQGIGWKYRTDGMVLEAATSSYPGYTLLKNKPVLVRDLSKETRFRLCQIARDHQAVSSISAVIPGKDRLFGAISAYTTKGRIFTNDDANFVQLVANLVGLAIERKLLHEDLHHSQESYRSLLDSSSDIIRTLTHQDAALIQSLADILGKT
jgi:PAS domain-containing protein